MQKIIGKNKSDYYFRIVASIFLISLLPILLFGIFLFANMQNFLMGQAEKNDMRYLTQTSNAMSLIMREVNNSYLQLSLDSSVRAYTDFPSKKYYETLRETSSYNDIVQSSKFVEVKGNLLHSLGNMASISDNIFSIYLYDSNLATVFTSSGTKYKIDDFYDVGWFDSTTDLTMLPVYMDTRAMPLRGGSNKLEVITVLFPILSDEVRTPYVLVINIDAEYFFDHTIAKIGAESESGIFVLDSKNNIIYENSPSFFGSYDLLLKNDFSDESGSFFTSLPGTRAMVSYTTSTAQSWKICMVSDYNKVLADMHNITLLFILLSFIVIALLIFVTLYSADRIYSPVQRALSFIRNKSLDSDGGSDMDIINTTLIRTVEHNEMLETELERSKPQYKQMFINALLDSTQADTFSDEYIANRFEYFNINLTSENLCVMILSFTRFDTRNEYILINNKISDVLSEKLAERGLCGVVSFTPTGSILALFNCTQGRLSCAAEIAQDVASAVSAPINIGISAMCSSYALLPGAYSQAVEALSYRPISQKSSVTFFSDISLSVSANTASGVKYENELFAAVKKGNLDTSLEVFNNYINVMTQSGINYIQMQQIFVKVLSGLLHIITETGIDYNNVFDGELNLQTLLSERKERTMVRKMELLLKKTVSLVETTKADKINNSVAAAEEYIKENFAKSISLENTADEIGLNPSYLSRIFKQFSGKTFVNYLTDMRLDEAKRRLRETDDLIAQISESIGYNNVHYFIKLFKSREGITPGEFRKQFENK